MHRLAADVSRPPPNGPAAQRERRTGSLFALRRRCGALAGILLVIAGCTQPPPQFRENQLAATSVELVDEHRAQIQATLTDLFGTPDAPLAPRVTNLDNELLAMAAGPAGYIERDDDARSGDEEYLQRGLYRQHCAACHGVTGDGMGPSAAVVAPYPRDFRRGVFKFKSTYQAAKPTDEDLRRILLHGLPGTSMPSFALLTEEQTEALVEYVKYLAIRGQVEQELIATVGDDFNFSPAENTTDDPFDPGTDAEDAALLARIVSNASQRWLEAEQQVVQPDQRTVPPEGRTAAEIAQSVQQGLQLYLSDRAKCTDCHGRPGAAVVAKDFDDWNGAVADFERKNNVLAELIDRRRSQQATLTVAQRDRGSEQLARDEQRLRRRQSVAWQLLEPRLDYPRSLANGVYHGGSQPIDLFRRVHQGIAGTPMPGHGPPRAGIQGALSEAEIWQLVDYLRSLRSSREL